MQVNYRAVSKNSKLQRLKEEDSSMNTKRL